MTLSCWSLRSWGHPWNAVLPTEECAVGEEHKAWCQKITLGVNFAMKWVCAFGQYTLPLGFQFPPPNNGDDMYLAE